MPVSNRPTGGFVPQVDRTGKHYGILTAQWPCGQNKHRQVKWLCLCDCGKLVIHHDLSTVTSCGCREGDITHGENRRGAQTAEYRAFHAAKARCQNPNYHRYKDWGGRGIQFRFTSIEEFIAEVGRKPTPRHSLDRWPNNDGHYEKGNVRWATPSQQQHNQRRSCPNPQS